MKNLIVFWGLLTLTFSVCWGHELQCGTPSVPEDSAILKELHQIRDMRSRTTYNDTLYFRVQIHIIRNSSHTTSLIIDSLKKDFEDLNLYFAPAAIRFYLCNDYNYIDNDLYYNFHDTDEAFLRQTYNDANAINVYFANTVYIGADSYAGYSYRPSSTSPNFVVIANNYVRKMTLMHEVGHFFNLLHTHDHENGYEYVNGSNCGSAGDFCCDTPADPELSESTVNTICQYIGTATDANGALYNPDTHNIMSYSRKKCKDEFSSDQYERIRDAAYLSCRQNMCNHCTTLENGSWTSNHSLTDDIVIIKNFTMDANSIVISACHEIVLKQTVTLQKGVILQP